MKPIFLALIYILFFSCNRSENDTNKNSIPQKVFIEALTKDSLQKNKSHIDSEEFVDSVMQVLDEAIDSPK